MEPTIKTQRLSLEQLRPNMALAEDAVNPNGVNVLSKNTVLTIDTFEKLRKNKVKFCVVWTKTIDNSISSFLENEKKSKPVVHAFNPVMGSPEFIKFADVYDKKITAFKNCLSIMKKGKYIDVNTLYTIVDGIISVVETKSDLFSYVCYLNDLDENTYLHSINVAIMCNFFGGWLKFSEEETKKLTIAGLLHDIGKSSMSDIKLNPADDLFLHPQFGYDFLNTLKIDNDIKNAVLMHHERIDGSGFPKGLKDEEISKYAKALSICDVYDNMVTVQKLLPFDVIKDFASINYALLDTEYTMKFIQNITYIYTGSWVRLSDNRMAEIMFINYSNISKPIIKIDDEIIDLARNPQLTIASMA